MDCPASGQVMLVNRFGVASDLVTLLVDILDKVDVSQTVFSSSLSSAAAQALYSRQLYAVISLIASNLVSSHLKSLEGSPLLTVEALQLLIGLLIHVALSSSQLEGHKGNASSELPDELVQESLTSCLRLLIAVPELYDTFLTDDR